MQVPKLFASKAELNMQAIEVGRKLAGGGA